MTLQAQLTQKLDIGTLVGGLLGEVGEIAQTIGATTLPADPDQIQGAAGPALTLEVGGIGQAAASVAARVAPALGGLAEPVRSLDRLRESMALLTEVVVQEPDLATQIRELTGRLGQTLTGGEGPEASFIARLQAFATMLGEAPVGGRLEELAQRVLRTVGVEAALDKGPIAGLVPAIAAALDVVGGSMSLETLLGEGERLALILRERLDDGRILQRVDALAAALSGGPGSLAARLQALDVSDAAEVAAVEAAIGAARVELNAIARLTIEGMAFGEATLTYLDLPTLQAQLTAAGSRIRNATLEPLEQTLAGLVRQLGPLLAVDLTAAPALSLDALMGLLESRVAEVADGIRNLDLTAISGPVTTTLGQVTDVTGALSQAVQDANLAVTGALSEVRDLARALPLDDIAAELRRVLEPVRAALQALADLLGGIEAALKTVLDEVQEQVNRAETALDAFKAAVDGFFAEAAAILDPARIDQVIGAVGGNIRAFADLIAQAQMQPYFDTAVEAVDTTTGVIEQVPFALLPDSMEGEVVAALRPVKQADAEALQHQIEALLQIGPDGRFTLRDDLEAAIAQVQAKYDALIDAIEGLDPRGHLQALDAGLQNLARALGNVRPGLDLAPVRTALDRLKSGVGGLDLAAALQPATAAFDQILARIDAFSPGSLIEPVEQELDRAREAALGLVRLREWSPALAEIQARAEAGLAALDPTLARGRIEAALQETLALLDAGPTQRPAPFGAIILDLLAGSGLKLEAPAFRSLLIWLETGGGAAALAARAARLADSVAATRRAVTEVDPAAIAARLAAGVTAMRSATLTLPGGAARGRLELAVTGLDPAAAFGAIGPNRARYLALLGQAVPAAEDIRRIRHPEVDTALGRLRSALAPLDPITSLFREVLARIGVTGLHEGLFPVLRRILAAALPERLSGLVAPLLEALHARAQALLDSVINPVRTAVDDLVAAADALDLAPLREALDGVHQAVRAEVAALHPLAVLGDLLTAFRAVQAEILAFDPLAAIEQALDLFTTSVQRLAGKLSANVLLARPLELYDALLAALGRLNLQALLAPLYDQLDAIAIQVSEGLERTVSSFERLQAAIPDRVGSTSVAGSVSVGAG